MKLLIKYKNSEILEIYFIAANGLNPLQIRVTIPSVLKDFMYANDNSIHEQML